MQGTACLSEFVARPTNSMPGWMGRMTFDGRPDVMILTCRCVYNLRLIVVLPRTAHDRVQQDIMSRLCYMVEEDQATEGTVITSGTPRPESQQWRALGGHYSLQQHSLGLLARVRAGCRIGAEVWRERVLVRPTLKLTSDSKPALASKQSA